MFSFRTTSLESQEDRVLHRGRIAVLCTQSAWDPETGLYSFESLYRRGNLRRIIFPEGDFPGGGLAAFGLEGCELCPLAAEEGGGYAVTSGLLEDVDALVVDYQDTGSRSDAMTMALYEIFQLVHHGGLSLSVYIVDRENMCGRWVEGTALIPDEEEAAGLEGIPQRHGLTLGELANLFYSELGAKFPLHIISYMVHTAAQMLMPWSVPPAKDVTGLFTSNFHCGMKLLSGTNVSYGEGTLLPYEVFGAPFMKGCMEAGSNVLAGLEDPAVFLRRTVFVPASGIHAGQVCYGFQMLPKPGVQYHSVAHALRIIRHLSAECPGLDVSSFRKVAGDELMTEYVHGRLDWNDLKEHIKVEEQKWIRKARRQMLYDDQLVRVKSLPNG